MWFVSCFVVAAHCFFMRIFGRDCRSLRAVGDDVGVGRKWVERALAVCVVVGLLVSGVLIFWPSEVAETVGDFQGRFDRVQVTGDFSSVFVPAAEAPPAVGDGAWHVNISGVGGVAALDRCVGSFTLMSDYAVDSRVVPVAAIHNGCGGQAVLNMREGDEVRVGGRGSDGVAGVYRVVGERVLPQVGTVTSDLVGTGGSLLLQTCFFSHGLMRFVVLDRVG